MRFKDYLTEAPRPDVAAASNREALKLFDGFKQNLSVAIDKEILLYRSAKTSGGRRLLFNFNGEDVTMRITQMTGRAEPRESKSSDNTLMYAASNWEGYPKRTYSTFATQSVDHAKNFGNPKVVIPADSVDKFGWMPEDFNESSQGSKLRKDKFMLQDLTQKIRSFVGCVGDLFRADDDKGTDFRNKVMDSAEDNSVFDELKATYYRPQLKQEKLTGFISFCDSMIRKRKDLQMMATRSPYSDSVMESLQYLVEFLEGKGFKSVKEAFEMVKPETFGATSYSSFSKTPKQENEKQKTEVWFEGDYLLITFDHDLTETSPDIQLDILKMIRDMMN